jgi:outer membrane cobalamin receptor
MQMPARRLRVSYISLAPALAWASLAAPELANAADDQLQEIVVTSTKREQSHQEVPMSVTARWILQ